MKSVLSIIALCACVLVGAQYEDYSTEQIIGLQGYPAETHTVTTSDGYILEINRIPHGKNGQQSNRPVVFLMHGLMTNANCYLFLGSTSSMGYILADVGFDVWLGNARGNTFSRKHVSLNPDDRRQKLDFFDFSFEEIGMYDLPAMVDYILEQTGQEKLHYIGHSQGGTVFLVLNSMRPEYNNKIASAHILAGVGYQNYFPDAELSSYARYANTIYTLAVSLGFVEFDGQSLDLAAAAGTEHSLDNCFHDPQYGYLCQLTGVNAFADEGLFVPTDMTNGILITSGVALKQIAHYGQNIRDKEFKRWDYGSVQNLFKYGSFSAPKYNLGLITVDTTMYYTLNDNLLDERDALAMVNDMPNTKAWKVARDNFTHTEFIYANDAYTLVTDYIIKDIYAKESVSFADLQVLLPGLN